MNHPVLGELKPLDDGRGWGLTVSLPAFQPCYERWFDDGAERPDTRDDDEKAGRFWLRIPTVPMDRPGKHGGTPPPSDAQVAAVEYLKANQARLAEVVGTALVEEAPAQFHWEYIEGSLADEMMERLATPDGMMQMVELQSLLLGVHERDGQVKGGFSFHSETLEPEHGVGVVVHRDIPVLVGTWDELMDMERPDEGDFADEIDDE